jgi:VIT1/CCC1 family predicted Fe2+/Mn2+ transporter
MDKTSFSPYNRNSEEQPMSNRELNNKIKAAQKSEITEHVIYSKLSRATRDSHNRGILQQISRDEMKHHNQWKEYTGHSERPNWIRVWTYYLISRIFGLTFGIKLMERGEGRAQATYQEISDSVPQALDIAREEDEHEEQLIGMIDEERLHYVGSMIRGLNDALVELTGALAGFTLALQKSNLIAMVGLITGIAAALSMGGTEYLAIKSEQSKQSPLKSALYTGTTYIFTVLFLVLPYLLCNNIFVALGIMIFDAIVVIVVFNFYISIATDQSFWKRFAEMALLSLGIAAASFAIGFVIRQFLGIEV